jgi:hypothetical protein
MLRACSAGKTIEKCSALQADKKSFFVTSRSFIYDFSYSDAAGHAEKSSS